MSAALATVWRIDSAGDPPRPLSADGVVEDAFGLCRGVISELSPMLLEPLSDADFEETLGRLCERVVVLQRRYDPDRSGIVFRPWLYARIRYATIDFWRWWFGRQGQKRVFDTRLLESSFADGGVDDGDPRERVLSGSAAEGASHSAEDWTSDLEWLYARPDRATLREERRLGLGSSARAARGDRRAGARAAKREAPREREATTEGVPVYLDCRSCGWRHYPEAPNGTPRWHYPTACLACQASLVTPAASAFFRELG